MIPVSEIFEVRYGHSLELNALRLQSDGIPFVSRTAKNNGVAARVARIKGLEPLPDGTISVAGGGSVMESFLQPEPYYSGFHLFYLTPIVLMEDAQKLFYCACLRANKYRFNYGRQANRTLPDLLIPSLDDIPRWVNEVAEYALKGENAPVDFSPTPLLQPTQWKTFRYDELFDIERGRGPRIKELTGFGSTPFITSIDSNNGLTGYTTMPPCHKANTITVNRNGSVAQAFYQPRPFCSTEDVHVFNPKFPLNALRAMFLCALIKQERYRFGYGRKWGIERMNRSEIRLPVNPDDTPNWEWIEGYIKTLSFSAQL